MISLYRTALRRPVLYASQRFRASFGVRVFRVPGVQSTDSSRVVPFSTPKSEATSDTFLSRSQNPTKVGTLNARCFVGVVAIDDDFGE